MLAAAALVAVAFVGFLVRYPKQDGDNMKGLYILDIAPASALCAAWSLDWLRRHTNRLAFAGALAWLAVIAWYDISFLVLG